MSEPLHPPGHGTPECWCLQCVFKRMDAKTAAVRATQLYEAVEAAMEPSGRKPSQVKPDPGTRSG